MHDQMNELIEHLELIAKNGNVAKYYAEAINCIKTEKYKECLLLLD